MNKDWMRDYFSFTKKERRAVLILVLLILLITMVPYMVPVKKDQVDEEALRQFQQEIARLKPVTKDTLHTSSNNYYSRASGYKRRTPENTFNAASLFYFDPNTLPEDGWIKLGLPEKTAGTIRHYIEKGGKFRKPEDIAKIYSLRKTDVNRLLPYVRLPEPVKEAMPVASENYPRQPYGRPSKTINADLLIDINHTDTATLQLLPGIGSKLAARIILFKEKLGGFYSVEQVAETYGLPDSTFQKIKSHLKVAEQQVSVIDLNTADANQLKQHPYINWSVANAIVLYRLQHGKYKNIDEILHVAVVSTALYKKLTPYLSVGYNY